MMLVLRSPPWVFAVHSLEVIFCAVMDPTLTLSLRLYDSALGLRFSSVQLLGDLLFHISGVTGKMTTETASEDDNFGTAQSNKVRAWRWLLPHSYGVQALTPCSGGLTLYSLSPSVGHRQSSRPWGSIGGTGSWQGSIWAAQTPSWW